MNGDINTHSECGGFAFEARCWSHTSEALGESHQAANGGTAVTADHKRPEGRADRRIACAMRELYLPTYHHTYRNRLTMIGLFIDEKGS